MSKDDNCCEPLRDSANDLHVVLIRLMKGIREALNREEESNSSLPFKGLSSKLDQMDRKELLVSLLSTVNNEIVKDERRELAMLQKGGNDLLQIRRKILSERCKAADKISKVVEEHNLCQGTDFLPILCEAENLANMTQKKDIAIISTRVLRQLERREKRNGNINQKKNHRTMVDIRKRYKIR